MNTLESLPFVNSFARLPDAFFARIEPTPLENPRLVAFNAKAAQLLDLHPDEAQRAEFAHHFGGAAHLPGAQPLAALYAGHQFGHFVPQLGDGRAILLGEVLNQRGERWEIQLKGAGATPFSRRGDGRAVLRSTIREYLCSEAMHGLGIPTTRALCIVGSTEEVYRESIETGAVLVRLAPSHVRFGSFEVFYYRGQPERLRELADYVIAHHFPHLRDSAEPYLALFREVTQRTARLMADWQGVGFAHGVMNTDNMSILGLTLDYGPFGFLDDYDPGFICNHSDYQGRYAFERQPAIGHWNLSCLGQALLPLLDPVPEEAAAKANAVLDEYSACYSQHFATAMRHKFGLWETRREDNELAERWLELLARERRDYTNSFRDLCAFDSNPSADNRTLRDSFVDRAAFDAWAHDYAVRLRAEGSDDAARRARMEQVNPRYVLRNYLAQQAIAQAEAGDFTEVERLHALLADPYTEQPGMDAYAEPPPDWGRQLEISCSS